MSKFVASFKAGLDAAKQMERNKDEVTQTIRTISRQILEETEHKVFLGFITKQVHYREETWLVAVSKNDDEGKDYKELAQWEPDINNGYPLIITIDHSSWHCSTAGEIEAALSEIVQIPAIAVKFLDLMNFSGAETSEEEPD